jgi:AcrR family transcriptional regulator
VIILRSFHLTVRQANHMLYTVSNEMARQYELKQRARDVEETRRRIVDATVALHEEVGPARTTIAAIAERAGVTRPTVYNQFPDELALFTACSAHWRALHPRPELGGVELEEGLRSLYGWYAANEKMLAHIERDARVLPALGEVLGHAWRGLDATAADLGGSRTDVVAAVRLALDFFTWSRLASSGLAPAEAAALMARLIRCV